MSKLLKTQSNEDIIYGYIGFDLCRKEIDQYENAKRTGTIAVRNPTHTYDEARNLLQCFENRAYILLYFRTKIDPIAIPIFNDVRECLFQNDSHIFNCKEELNELAEAVNNPRNYMEMLKWSTPHQRQPKRYNTTLHVGRDDLN